LQIANLVPFLEIMRYQSVTDYVRSLWQSDMLIQMLMTASELINMGVSSEQRRLEDAQTLVRVLCHKKDRNASKFLKRQYELPMSTGKNTHTHDH